MSKTILTLVWISIFLVLNSIKIDHRQDCIVDSMQIAKDSTLENVRSKENKNHIITIKRNEKIVNSNNECSKFL